MNLLDAFDSAVRKTPAKPFLRDRGASISYADMQQRSQRAAAVLQAQGVGRGDTVALMCLNTPGFVEALLGAWRLGATLVPVNHKLQAPELQYILDHAQCRALVFDAALAPVVTATQHRCAHLVTEAADAITGARDWDALVAAASPLEGTRPADGDIAQVLYTSGTTGRPKGCLLSHRAVTLAAITAGGTVVLLREYHPQHFLQAVQDEGVTLYFGAPVSYFAPLQMLPDFGRYDLSSVRAWVYGGGPIGADMAHKLASAYRSDRFYQVYGMTETGPTGTTLYPEEQVERAGSIGRVALPGVDMRVVRDDGGDAAPGDTGEIWLRTGSAMDGYLHDPEATAAAFAPGGWYRTGDLARLDDAGYLFIVDRTRDMVITGGENVYSKEVEDALSAHPEVADVAVVGRPHAEWGETVIAHVVPRGEAAPDAGALQQFLAGRLARYKIPREFVFATSLPRTPTGKLQKFLLRQQRSAT
jgi:feruloyl-CoA synthase